MQNKVYRFEMACRIGGLWRPILTTPFGCVELPIINTRQGEQKMDEIVKFESVNLITYESVE